MRVSGPEPTAMTQANLILLWGMRDCGYEIGRESVGTHSLQNRWIRSGFHEVRWVLEPTQDFIVSDNCMKELHGDSRALFQLRSGPSVMTSMV